MTKQSVHYHGPACDPPHRGEQFLGDHGDELADLQAKVERAILGEPCAEHGKAACIQTPTCRVEWVQKRLSRDIVRDLIGEVSE